MLRQATAGSHTAGRRRFGAARAWYAAVLTTCGIALAVPLAAGAANPLLQFTTAPSTSHIVVGQSVTDVATAVGNSTSGAPSGVTTINDAVTISGSTTVGSASGGLPGVRVGDAAFATGVVPAGTTVADISASSVTLSAGALKTGTSTIVFGAFPVKFTVCLVTTGTTCATTPAPVATSTDTLNTSTYTRTYTSASFAPPAAGTWCFTATYAKDVYKPMYDAATESNPTGECVTVSAPPPVTTTVTTTTVVTTTTTTPTTTTTTPTPPAPPLLRAQLVAAKAGHSKLGARVVKVELVTNVKASVALRLTRANKTLVGTTINALAAGDRVLVLVVPRRVTKGPATVHVTITTSLGEHKAFHTTINIPAR